MAFTVFATFYVHFGRIFSGRVAAALLLSFWFISHAPGTIFIVCAGKLKNGKTNWKNVCGQHRTGPGRGKEFLNCSCLLCCTDNV